jgi:3-phosphoinositide dependent protein kinase-1
MSLANEYMVGPIIGQGSFAHVVYAVHKTSKQKVAIKVVEQISFRKYPWLLQAVMKEKNILQSNSKDEDEKSSSNSWIVNLWAAFYDSQHLYLVMELCDGGDLEGLLRGKLRLNNANEEPSEHFSNISLQMQQQWLQYSVPFYASQILHAVQFLHTQKRIIHCDLKPSNCLLNAKTGQLKLADFGCAIEMDQNLQSLSASSSLVSMPRGTSEYSSPEIIRGNLLSGLNEAVDYWSVGCILYAMTNDGVSPFSQESEALTVKAIMEYCEESSNVDVGDFALSASMQDWQSLSTGLLRADPMDRLRFWENLSGTHQVREENPTWDMEKVILPSPLWKAEVKNARLKDGSKGWIAFQQI